MKKLILLLSLLFTVCHYSQGCVDRIVCSDDMVTLFLLDGSPLSWGKNQFGQMGNGTTIQQNTPIPTVNGINWSDVNHGRTHTTALHQNGTVWSWGDNALGQLGDGSITTSLVPVQVGSDDDWIMISPGNLHTVALKTNGTLWGWGNTGAFELTNGPAPFYHISPIQIDSSTDWTKIYGGYFKTFAIKNNGTLWGRGRNNYGDLGTGNTFPLITLTQIGTDADWQKISAARGKFTLALKTNGTLWAWGDNENGRLGDGTTTNHYTPVQIGNSTWKDITAGNFHSLGIKTDGTLWEWGINVGGVYLSPFQVGTETDWKSVAAGNYISYAVKENNTLFAWGWGILGDGTSTPHINPTLISCNQLNTSTFQETTLIYYPNPVKNELNISDITNIESFVITNILGQKVLHGPVKDNKIDLSRLSKGVYICLFLKKDSLVTTYKFIKD